MKCFHRFRPDLVVIEQQAFMQKRTKFSEVIGELQGVMKNRLWLADAVWVPKQVNSLKKFATGNGRAEKPEMLEAARRRWPECPNHDLGDAFWLAAWGDEMYEDIVHDG